MRNLEQAGCNASYLWEVVLPTDHSKCFVDKAWSICVTVGAQATIPQTGNVVAGQSHSKSCKFTTFGVVANDKQSK